MSRQNANRVEDMPAFENIESHLRRAKHRNVPRIPQNIQDVQIEGT